MSEQAETSNYEQLRQEIEQVNKRFEQVAASRFERFASAALWVLVLAILGITVVAGIWRISDLQKDYIGDGTYGGDAEIVLERAEDAVRSVELVLAFLEGASVLLALAVGVAAIYGFRQSGEIRKEFREELGRMQAIRDQLVEHQPQLRNLDQLETQLNASISTLKNMIAYTTRLLQADQEFRLDNYELAYEFLQEVLENDPDNLTALYMAGWLETHHIKGKAADGIDHLRRLVDMAPNWASAIAAYGVALRREAMRRREAGEPYEDLLHTAHGKLREALAQNFYLVDFNHEAFWGPVGGIWRDLGDTERAIEAYQNALRVTPGSSYPQGNLAALYLHKAGANKDWEQKALDAFEATVKYANIELSVAPNNYFLIMDLAMAETVLGYNDKNKFQEAREHLERALDMQTSPGLVEVSRRGWRSLQDGLPQRRGWETVRREIDSALEAVGQAIRKLSEET